MQFKTKAEVPSRWSTYMHRSLGSSAVQPWVLSYWIRLPEYNIQKKSFFLSLEVFPHRFQPSVSGYSEKECALAHSRAEARLLQQPSTLAPSAHPRGAFLSYRNEVSYTIKKLPPDGIWWQFVLFMTIECSQSVHSIVVRLSTWQGTSLCQCLRTAGSP